MSNVSWNIAYDPMQLLVAKDPVQLELMAQEQGEDILQATCGNKILDLGWYRDHYKVLLIEDSDWEHPVHQTESSNLQSALALFREFLGTVPLKKLLPK
ncbi:MAG: hypothetical protein LBQ32_11100 [Burkholderiaceae bacterium]|jgi:hypothetical protein|nr:hypothetical protein [Burkholderiaceae bacterium]